MRRNNRKKKQKQHFQGHVCIYDQGKGTSYKYCGPGSFLPEGDIILQGDEGLSGAKREMWRNVWALARPEVSELERRHVAQCGIGRSKTGSVPLLSQGSWRDLS